MPLFAKKKSILALIIFQLKYGYSQLLFDDIHLAVTLQYAFVLPIITGFHNFKILHIPTQTATTE